MIDWSYPLVGLAVGFAVGLTGVGGGALMTPLLHIGFGIPIATAVGTDLLRADASARRYPSACSGPCWRVCCWLLV